MPQHPKLLVLGFFFALALTLGASAAAQDDMGESVYNNNCASCHQPNGEGIAGAFPPLAGHVPHILEVEGGRSYLIHVLLYGLQGEITVMGETYSGAMPAWAQLSDEQLAAVLTHIATAWENEVPEDFEPFTAEEVAAARDKGLSPQDVLAMREELPLEEEESAE